MNHTYDQIVHFNDTANVSEDYIEKSHQDGSRNEYQIKGLVNRAIKANIHCTYERNKSRPLEVDRLNNVNNATKRKFKNAT